MVMPPLGLWYLAAQLEAQGHRTDFRALDVDELPADGDFDQVWISATSPQMHNVREIAAITREWKKTRTVFGGAAPWARPESALMLGFDVVVAGEADKPETVAEIVRLGQGKKTGGVHELHPKITLGPLDWCLPPVRRWDERYHFELTGRDGLARRATTMFGSRGCPMACAFCESGRNGIIWDRAVRYEPIGLIETQLDEIVARGHGAVQFYDDILPLNKPRTLEIMGALKRRDLIWRCFVRTDVIAKQGGFEYLKSMAEAGLVEVLAGVESADNRIKNGIHKGTTIEQDTDVLKWCKQLGIKFKASFILGLPGEDKDSLARTREWIFTNRPDRADVNALIPMPGTPITQTHDYQGNEYDVTWTGEYSEEEFYKGKKRSASVVTSTSHLTSAQIAAFRDNLIRDMEEAGILY